MSPRERDEPVRLTKIYTRGGDAGETSLGDMSRVSKLDPLVAAYGINLVHDLRSVFPTTAVVALSKSPVTRSAAAREGAVALEAGTSRSKLATLCARLARR